MTIKLEDVVEHSSDWGCCHDPPQAKCFMCNKPFKPLEAVFTIAQCLTDSVGEIGNEKNLYWMDINGKQYLKQIAFHEKCFLLVSGKKWEFE